MEKHFEHKTQCSYSSLLTQTENCWNTHNPLCWQFPPLNHFVLHHQYKEKGNEMSEKPTERSFESVEQYEILQCPFLLPMSLWWGFFSTFQWVATGGILNCQEDFFWQTFELTWDCFTTKHLECWGIPSIPSLPFGIHQVTWNRIYYRRSRRTGQTPSHVWAD